MDTVKFGITDYRVSRLGLGCMSMSGCYGAQDDNECIRTIHRALERGINFLDTSHSYGQGHNQRLIGEAIKGRRDQVVIHSKTGSPRNKPGDDINRGGGNEAYLRKTCEESLQRLGTDHLDILCMSRVDRNVPIEESVGAMAKMVQEGKTRYIALSEASPESIRRAWTVHPIASLQIEYSLFSRDPEEFGNLDAVRKHGMSLMAYAPLGKGLLSGAFPRRPRMCRPTTIAASCRASRATTSRATRGSWRSSKPSRRRRACRWRRWRWPGSSTGAGRDPDPVVEDAGASRRQPDRARRRVPGRGPLAHRRHLPGRRRRRHPLPGGPDVAGECVGLHRISHS